VAGGGVNVRAALLRNTFWYGVVTVIGLVSGLLMSIVLARGLRPALMGDYSYLLWALRVAGALATLGYPLATARYSAEAVASGDVSGAWSYVRLFLGRQILATTVVVAALMPVIFWVAPATLRWPAFIFALALFPITLEAIYSHSVYGAQRYDLTAQTSTIKMTLQLLASVAVVMLGGGLVGLVMALTAGLLVSCVIQRRRALELYGAHRAEPPAPLTPDIRAYLLPLSMVAVLDAIVWDRSEVFFLKLWASSEAIAFYSLAFGLATKLMVIPEIAVGALLPAFSALHGRGVPDQFTELYRTSLRYVALAGAPISAVLAAVAPGLIVWLYGEDYRPAAQLLGAMAGVALLSALRKVAWAALRAAGDRRCALTATVVAVVLNIVLAAVLIPYYTTVGAVVAQAAGQLVGTAWVFVGMARLHGSPFPAGALAKIVAAGGVSFAAAWWIAGSTHDPARLIAGGAAGFVVFLVACVSARLVGTREWTFVMTSTRRVLGVWA
jgi:O-antigen/teichoic acid export membrane protein